MALVIEDGTGKTDAESYNSASDLDTYFAENVSPSGWSSLTSAQKEAYARQATRWMDGQWSWASTIYNTTGPQALAWPRSAFYDSDGRSYAVAPLPAPILVLHAEIVKLAVEGRLQLAEIERGGGVQSESAGPVSHTYFPGASARHSYPYLDAIARPLTAWGGANVLVRA